MLKLECATIEKAHPFIYIIKHNDGHRIEIEDALKINIGFKQIVTEKYFYAIIDTKDQHNNFSKEALNYLAKEAPIIKEKKLRGVAIIIKSLPNRLIANFFKNIHTPKYPFKIFKSEESALEWIESLRHKKDA